MTTKQAEWSERVRDWKRSGLSSSQFCEGKPYRASTLQWWSTKLRAQRTSSLGPPGAAGPKPEVRLVRVERIAAPSARLICVEVGEARIVVTTGFDPTLLRAVVAALEVKR